MPIKQWVTRREPVLYVIIGDFLALGVMLHNEQDKAEIELAVFREFLLASGLAIDPGSLRKGNPNDGEPDVLCEISSEPIAFELAESCAPEFPAAAAAAAKSEFGINFSWGEDVSQYTLRNKLQKRYSVSYPLHLLLYAGRSALPDESIIGKLEPELENGLGQFESVWFFGERVHKVAGNAS